MDLRNTKGLQGDIGKFVYVSVCMWREERLSSCVLEIRGRMRLGEAGREVGSRKFNRHLTA